MGRNQVAAVRRNVARPWEPAAHHVTGVITPYGVTGNVVLVILAVSVACHSIGGNLSYDRDVALQRLYRSLTMLVG